MIRIIKDSELFDVYELQIDQDTHYFTSIEDVLSTIRYYWNNIDEYSHIECSKAKIAMGQIRGSGHCIREGNQVISERGSY